MSTKNCNPLNSVYCNLKVKLAGNLSEKDLAGLYSCTLCNECHTADFNRGAREMAVSRNLVAPHVGSIGKSIRENGNPYGIAGRRTGSGKTETILFRGCTSTYKAPAILAAVESLLGKKGIEYGTLDGETCCGNVLFNLGDRAAGAEAVKANIAKFKAAGVRKIITVCPGCYTAFNKYYKGQDGFNPEVVLAVDLLSGMTASGDFAVQDPCHGKEKSDVVRSLLPGTGSKSVSPCCGAGSGVMTHDRLLAGSKAEKAVSGSQSKIVTYCPFCYLSLSAVKPESVSDIYVLLDKSGVRSKA